MGEGTGRQLFGEEAEKGRGDTEPHLKREAGKTRRRLGGLFLYGLGRLSVYRAGSVSKEKMSGGRDRMKVQERNPWPREDRERTQTEQGVAWA